MYNYSLILTYKNNDDTTYRKELLEAFHLKEYTHEINKYRDQLYDQVKNEYSEVVQCLTQNDPLAMFRSLNEKDCFMLLFSWDFFYDNHQLLKAIHNKTDDISLRKKTLMDNIKYNKK